MHVGQAEVAAASAECQPLVIETQEVQDRGVQVVHRADVLDRIDSQFVGRADQGAAFRAAASQPDREALGMMVAAVAAC